MIIYTQNNDGFVVAGVGSKICIQENTNQIIFDNDFAIGEYKERNDAQRIVDALMEGMQSGEPLFCMPSASIFDHDKD